MRFAIKTFGCKVNQYESSAISAEMEKEGFEPSPRESAADIIIINSCTVTADSSKKSLREIRRIKRAFPEKKVALCGCFPQAFPEEAKKSGADIVAGTGERSRLPELIKRCISENSEIIGIPVLPSVFEEMRSGESADKTRAFLKIEDGCDSFCSYCIIPAARGRVRSRALASIAAETEKFVSAGHKEIVLVGINLSCYGKDIGLSLADAVETVCAVKGVERVRLSSLEPELLDGDTLRRFAAQDKLCPHFHLSLQSGCGETLKRMNRHYTPAQFLELVQKLRELFPGCAVTTDMMAGFMGETEEEFSVSLKLAEKAAFAKIHAFAYSVREGTAAAKRADRVPEEIKRERFRRLCALDERLHREFLEKQVGTVQPVLIQKRTSPEFVYGLTPNYTPVRIYGSAAKRHEIVPVRIIGAENEYCLGERQKK